MDQICEDFTSLNKAFKQLFQNSQNKSQHLTKKYYMSLYSKVYKFVQNSSAQQSNKNKQALLRLFRIYLGDIIKNVINFALNKCQEQEDFIHEASRQWENFKRFTFYYFALFQNCNSHYEQAHKIFYDRGIVTRISEQNCIFPIPAVALFLLKSHILHQYQYKFKKIIISHIKMQRQGKIVENDREILRNIFEMVWSCGLNELARIKISQGNIFFYREEKIDLLKHLKHTAQDSEIFFSDFILKDLSMETTQYYLDIYNNKIKNLSLLEDVYAVTNYNKKQKQIANYYLITQHQKTIFLNAGYKILNERDIQQRINRGNGIKVLLQQLKSDSQQYFPQVVQTFKVLMVNKQSTRSFVKQIIQNHIKQNGERINKKIGKQRQYVIQMIELKKIINKITEQMLDRDFDICLARDQSFKKILDSLEASRNLSEYTDFIIKQCIKLKLNDDQYLQRFKNVFMILENLGAQDSYLLHHQQRLGHRILESLNEPKLQIQMQFLKKLSEKLGSISLTSHMAMIKDIENSLELSQKYSKLMSLFKFNWSMRIISQSYWPDSISKPKIQIQPPNYLYKQCQTIKSLYKKDFQYRHLNWRLEKGSSLIQGRYPHGKFRFQTENIYLMILLHISDQKSKKMLFGHLKQKIKLVKEFKQGSDNIIQKYVLVLVENKLITRQKPFNEPLTVGQQLTINMQYKPNSSVKPNQIIIIRPSPEMHKAFHQNSIDKAKVMKQREKLIEAALVKVLKHNHSSGNNSVTFQELYKAIQTHNHLKMFQFSESAVKERLEQLIYLGYCERDEEDRKIYHYVA